MELVIATCIVTEHAKGSSGGAADAEETVPLQAAASASSISAEQTTLVHNEEEAFALEPLDVTAVPGYSYYSCFDYRQDGHTSRLFSILFGGVLVIINLQCVYGPFKRSLFLNVVRPV